MRRATLALIAAATLPLALAGCGTDPEAGDAGGSAAGTADDANDANDQDAAADDAGDAAERVPGEWIPESLTLDGETYALPATDRTADALVTIDPGSTEDDGGRSGVYVGCNSTGTDMSIEGDTLRVSGFVSTMMACGEDVDRFERGAVQLFESDPTFALSDGGDTLTLTADNGDTMTLTRGEERPITGVRWVPESVYVDGEDMARPEGSDGAHLEIEPAATPEDGGDLDFSSGCNQLNTTAVIEWRTLTIGQDGGLTEIGCPGALREWDDRVLGIFADDLTYALDHSGNTLTLTSADGDSMTLTRDADAR
ncbi:META domain-containing protein [Streptomyces sp. B6B3]|uniref:META domain-containing protein n=1 Tax=Streptomyces sp. B6B3 TaxID=3153570 RepID=UPI00325CBAF5